MEQFFKEYGGYIVGTLLFWFEFIVWHIVKRYIKCTKHKNIAPKVNNDEK